MVRLFERVLWRKTTYYRKSGFRVAEQSDTRIVLRTRNYAFMFGGVFFSALGVAVAWVAVSKARDEIATLIASLVFAALCMLFGLAAAWVSRTQRDAIIVDRDRGIVRSERTNKRARSRAELWTIRERPLSDLAHVELRRGSSSAWLQLHFRHHDPLDVDFATDVDHLRMLGARLAATSGVELKER